MHLETVLIANHQQRRVLQIFSIAQELKVGGVQVVVLALVFPGKVPLLPYISKALVSFNRGDVLFEGKALAGLVDRSGVGLAQHIAEITEMLLRAGALGEGTGFPAGDEFGECERHESRLRSKDDCYRDVRSRQVPARVSSGLVPQVRVRLLDANLGRGTFGMPGEHSPCPPAGDYNCAMYLEVVGAVKHVEVIAAGLGVRERRRLWKAYGRAPGERGKGSQGENLG